MSDYPSWFYYPSSEEPPDWIPQVVDVFREAQLRIDSSKVDGKGSNAVLAELAPNLRELGFKVESEGAGGRIRRAVLFGEQGRPRVSYEVDAFHDELGIVAEIEAGRGWMSNAFYRDIVRTSLIVNARYLVVGMPIAYRYRTREKEAVNESYRHAREQLDALYASGRLRLPFDGLLLIGY